MVAQRCGVSPSTVSRILNGTAVVSDEKRAAVEQAIADLGFVPNPVARGLAGGRSWSVGVVTQTIDSPFFIGGAPKARPRKAPALGEHSDQVLRDAGYDDAAIAKLRDGKVVA